MAVNSRLLIVMTQCLRTSLCRAGLLAVGLGLLPSASFAHTVICGDETNVNVAIASSAVWVPLEDCWLDLSDGYHDCKMTASADIDNPGAAAQNRYRFDVEVNGAPPATDSGTERIAAFPNANLPASQNVTTVRKFQLAPGLYQFASYGRKQQAATVNSFAFDSSLGVVCADQDLNPPPDQDPDNDGLQ
jgi:hypothetical protein